MSTLPPRSSESLQPPAGSSLAHPAAQPDVGSPRSRRIALIVTVVLYGFLALSQNMAVYTQPAESQVGQKPQSVGAWKMVLMLDHALKSKGELFATFERLSVGTEEHPVEALARIIATGQSRGPDEALDALDALTKNAQWNLVNDETGKLVPDPDLNADARIIDTLYSQGPDALDAQAKERLVERYGWLGRLALTSRLPENDPRREALFADMGWVVLLMVMTLVLAGIALVGGLTAFIVAAVMFSQRRIPSRFVPPAPGGSVYLETFAVFLVLFLFVHLLFGSLSQYAIDQHWSRARLNTLILFQLIAQWAILPVIFWPVLRGVPFARWREQVGWIAPHGVAREMLAGCVGYLAGLPIYFAAMILSMVLLMVQSRLTGRQPAVNNPVVDFIEQGQVLLIVLVVALATIWAPIVEETLFRGGLYRHFRARLGVFGAGLLSAVLFAGLHAYGPLLLPPLIVLGFNFAMMRQWRGSLLASMTAHGLHNGTLMVLSLVALRALA